MTRPLHDWLVAFESCVRDRRPAEIVVLLSSLVVAWWLYVPVHELAHAWGCLSTGGAVTRLEISRIYGAGLLARIFPYVTVGSEYADRLSGFDTRGSDLTHLATCAAPFVLTILVGVPLLRAVPLLSGWRRGLALGVALPMAYAPFVSIPGDYYEMGSILVSRLVTVFVPHFPTARWRSDDVFRLVGSLTPDANASDVAGIAASLLVGVVLALMTYWAGVAISAAAKRSNAPVS